MAFAMYVHQYEASTPKRTLFGNATWLLIHTAPYQAKTLSADELRPDEKGLPPHVAFASRYVALVESVVSTYPCCSCRRHFATNPEAQMHLRKMRQYANSIRQRPFPSADDVADTLAIAAFSLHNTVTAAVSVPGHNVYGLPDDAAAEHEVLSAIQNSSLAGMQKRMERGLLSRAYVALVLRARWQLH